MTTYVTHESAGQCVLWGDTLDEGLQLAACVDADLDIFVFDSFPRIMVTPAAALRACSLGAHRVDWLEPKYQHAILTGNIEAIQAVERYRAAWLLTGSSNAAKRRAHPS